MAPLENEVNPRVPNQSQTNTLTFITTEGEQIVFEGMDVPVEEAAALMGQEAFSRIWNRPAEDDAWHGLINH